MEFLRISRFQYRVPVRVLGRALRCVVGAAGVQQLDVLQVRGLEAELLDVGDVGLVLEPEHLVALLAESADPLVELPRRDRAASADRPSQQRDAVHDLGRVEVRPLFVHDARRLVVRVLGEVRRQEADPGQALEGLEQRAIPLGRRLDHVVVELEEVRRGREPERLGVRVLADVLRVVDDPEPGIRERVEVGGRPVGRAVVPDHDLGRERRRHAEDLLDAEPQQVLAIVREDDDGDHDGRPGRTELLAEVTAKLGHERGGATGSESRGAVSPVRGDGVCQSLRILDERHEARLGEPPGGLELVVVDGLAEGLAARHDVRALAVPERDEDRADARVRDDDARLPDEVAEPLERHVRNAVGVRRPHVRRPVLDDELLSARERVDGMQQPVERELARSDRDEDHRSPNTVPTYRARGSADRSSGHWT